MFANMMTKVSRVPGTSRSDCAHEDSHLKRTNGRLNDEPHRHDYGSSQYELSKTALHPLT